MIMEEISNFIDLTSGMYTPLPPHFSAKLKPRIRNISIISLFPELKYYSIYCSSRFASIAWSSMAMQTEEYPMGIIAGGMIDGQINIWNPIDIINGGDGLISVMHHHQGAVQGLDFNPHKESSSLLASGGNDGEVYIISLEDATNPVVFAPADSSAQKHTADITKVAWNTEVAHIIASASQNGSCFIWDLKQKKAWYRVAAISMNI
jgi:protein transport protein SEC31